ncbi:hypothetical protein C8J56DRAFT_1094386 [Mycena floridula]|nr:hypothetical protein C8J56DRAFT_1094386 [Mycena floridula]
MDAGELPSPTLLRRYQLLSSSPNSLFLSLDNRLESRMLLWPLGMLLQFLVEAQSSVRDQQKLPDQNYADLLRTTLSTTKTREYEIYLAHHGCPIGKDSACEITVNNALSLTAVSMRDGKRFDGGDSEIPKVHKTEISTNSESWMLPVDNDMTKVVLVDVRFLSDVKDNREESSGFMSTLDVGCSVTSPSRHRVKDISVGLLLALSTHEAIAIGVIATETCSTEANVILRESPKNPLKPSSFGTVSEAERFCLLEPLDDSRRDKRCRIAPRNISDNVKGIQRERTSIGTIMLMMLQFDARKKRTKENLLCSGYAIMLSQYPSIGEGRDLQFLDIQSENPQDRSGRAECGGWGKIRAKCGAESRSARWQRNGNGNWTMPRLGIIVEYRKILATR